RVGRRVAGLLADADAADGVEVGAVVADRRGPELARLGKRADRFGPALGVRGGRDRLAYELGGGPAEEAVRGAVLVFHDLAALGRARRPRDSRRPESKAVREVELAVEAADERGVVARDGIDEVLRGQELGGPRGPSRGPGAGRALRPRPVRAPIAADEPGPRGQAARGFGDLLAERGGLVDLQEVQSEEQAAGLVEVRVVVDEAG